MRPDEELELGRALRASPLPAAGPCPPDAALAGYAEGRLPEEKRARVEEHLTTCDACRVLIAELGSTLETPAAAHAPLRALPRSSSARWRPWAIAAAVLLGLGAGWTLWQREAGEGSADKETELLAAVDSLRTARPDLFAEFLAVGSAERARGDAPTNRSGLTVLAPAETISNPEPEIVWTPIPGAKSYTVRVLRADGPELWSRESASSPLAWPEGQLGAPPDVPLIVEVVGEGALGRTTARRSFRRPSQTEYKRLKEGMREIVARVPEQPLRDIVAAQFAARSGFLELAAFLLKHPEGSSVQGENYPAGSSVRRETRGWVLRRLGWSEEGALPAEDHGGL